MRETSVYSKTRLPKCETKEMYAIVHSVANIAYCCINCFVAYLFAKAESRDLSTVISDTSLGASDRCRRMSFVLFMG